MESKTWLLVGVLLCLFRWAEAEIDHTSNALAGLVVNGLELEPDAVCFNTMMACSRTCDMAAKEVDYRPIQQPQLWTLALHLALYASWFALAIVLVYALQREARHHSVYKAWKAREAELLHRCQGVTAQAFDFAERLKEAATPSPAATAATAACNSKEGVVPLLLHSPAGHYNAGQGNSVCPSAQPHSAASTPPAPASETSAPNLALLLAEAPPAPDAANNSDQLAYAPMHSTAGTSSLKASPAGYDKGARLQSPNPGPGAYMPQPYSASRSPVPLSSPAGAYSASSSPNPAAPPGSTQRMLPGGPVALPGGARPSSSPAPASASPSAGYSGPQLGPTNAQRSGTAGSHWTPQPQHQPQGQQPPAMSCPPAAGTAACSPYGAGFGAQGPAPHSAGQLGGAMPGMAVQHRAPEPATGALTPPSPAGLAGWVNTSRGSNTPLPFGSASTPGMQHQQQPFASPMPGFAGSPLSAGMSTPGTASTAQTGSMTHVHSVHSTAGSCGGPAATPGSSTMPGSTTPMSAGSSTSGARRSSVATRSPNKLHDVIMGQLCRMEAKSQGSLKELDEKKRAALQRNQAAPALAAAASPQPSSVRQSPV